MTFTFENHLKALVYLHLHEYESGRELLQVMEQDDFARSRIAPPESNGWLLLYEKSPALQEGKTEQPGKRKAVQNTALLHNRLY